MNAERTPEPSEFLRELRAARTPLAAEGRVDAMAEIAEIDAALARADHGTYGTCIACGNRIALDRLALLPATPYCLECATESMHDPRQPTVAFGSLRGEQVRFFTDTELGTLLSRSLRGVTRHHQTPAIGAADAGCRA